MFFKKNKYKNDCVNLIMRASSLEKRNALYFFDHIEGMSEYYFNYIVGEPVRDVIGAYIIVFNEVVHIHNALEDGFSFETKLANSGKLNLLSIITLAYYAGKKSPYDDQFKSYLPVEFHDRFSDFYNTKLPTVSHGMVDMKVWMEEMPSSETLGIFNV
jgi:hypothetical protein